MMSSQTTMDSLETFTQRLYEDLNRENLMDIMMIFIKAAVNHDDILSVAVMKGDLDIIEYLWKHKDLLEINKDDISCAVCQAIHSHNIEVLKFFVDLNKTTTDDFVVACQTTPDIVEILYEKHKDDISYGLEPAAKFGKGVLQFLFKHVKPEDIMKRMTDLLHYTYSVENLDNFKYVLSLIPEPNYQEIFDLLCIHSYGTSTTIIEYLLEKGAIIKSEHMQEACKYENHRKIAIFIGRGYQVRYDDIKILLQKLNNWTKVRSDHGINMSKHMVRTILSHLPPEDLEQVKSEYKKLLETLENQD